MMLDMVMLFPLAPLRSRAPYPTLAGNANQPSAEFAGDRLDTIDAANHADPARSMEDAPFAVHDAETSGEKAVSCRPSSDIFSPR
jgi:hypothetical protein